MQVSYGKLTVNDRKEMGDGDDGDGNVM